MTPTISCLYMTANRDPANFTFIKFNNFVKVIFNDRMITIPVKQLIANRELFQLYIVSLLFTEDTSEIYKDTINDCVYYGVSTLVYSDFNLANSYKVIYLTKSHHRNPLNSKEPKRASSKKKYNKFMKYFYNCCADESYIVDPGHLLRDYYSGKAELIGYFNEYLETEIHSAICELESIIDE